MMYWCWARWSLPLVGVMLFLHGSAHAGYAQAVPSSVFSSSGGTVMYEAAANDVIAGGIARVAEGASLTVGSELVTMPVAVRFAANAGKYVVDGLWANPVAIGVGAAAWLASECVAYQGGFVWTCGHGADPVSDGLQYRASNANFSLGPYETTQAGACAALAAQVGLPVQGTDPCTFGSGSNPALWYSASYSSIPNPGCPSGWYITSSGCVATEPPVQAALPDIEAALGSAAIPDSLPQALPFPLPVQQPILNPDTEASPQPQPLWVPQGNPVPVPNTNPQQYSQPGTRLTPTPSPSSPWQVDVAPDPLISESPTPTTDPQVLSPTQTASSPVTSDPANDAPPTDTPLPAYPTLYTPKYPNGLVGVWQTDSTGLQSTALVSLASSLIPSIPDGGSCPVWNIDLDIASWANFGTQNVAPPCSIWAFCRIVILLGALFLCRALIFGG